VRAQDYFAALVKPEEFGKQLSARIQEYRSAQAVTVIQERIEKAYQYHFGISPSGMHLNSGVQRAGEQGELAEVHVNHLRANALTVLNLTVGPKISWVVTATNSDSASTKQAFAATSILDYYWLDREVSASGIQAVSQAIPLGEGFVFMPWREHLGEPVLATSDGQPAISGDFAFYNPLSWEVVRDPSKRSWDQCNWVAVCLWENKYEVAALHPDKADDVLGAKVDDHYADRQKAFGTSDDIPVWYFFHKKSPIPELRQGREAVLLENGTVLRDGALTYDSFPLHRVVPDEQFGTPYGYSQYHEGIGIQEATDSLTSAILTNQDAFARQMVAIGPGESFSPDQIAGMSVLQYNQKPPQALQLTASPAEAFKFVDILKQDLRRIQGVNDAVQGQLPGDAKLSGAALALLSSQAIQQNSTLQTNYVRMVKAIGNCLLTEWKKRTPLPRKIKLVGKTNAFLCREESYSGKDVSDIKAVSVDIGNPLQQTHAGKMELAQLYIQTGGVTSPEQIEMVVSTGKIEHLTKATRDELILIQDENEKIADGITPLAVIHDDHLRHGREHRSTLASVAARDNPKIVQASTEHLHQHYKLFFGWPGPMDVVPPPPTDPVTGMPDESFDPTSPINDPMYRERMLILVGQQPPPPIGPPMGAMLPPGEGGGPPPPASNDAAEVMAPQEPIGNKTNLPSMPKNPQTGERFIPPNGQTAAPQ